jgi:PBP1b-binding outer membrane lipoprotein LpoB
MKRVLIVAAFALTLASCGGNATSTDANQVDSTQVTTDSTAVSTDSIVGPGQAEVEGTTAQ